MKPPILTAVSLIVAAWPLVGLAQQPSGPNIDGSAAIAAIERTLVAAIARAELSVVAISRTAPGDAPFDADAFGDLRQSRVAEGASATVAAGVIIDPAGLVLTHYLAVREADEHTVTTIDGKTHPATIRAADPRSALAVLAIEPTSPQSASPLQRTGSSRANAPAAGTFPAIPFGDADELRKGQFVVAIGNPFAIESDGQPTASWGIVTNLARKAPGNTNLNDAPGPNGDHRTTLHHLGTLIQTDARLGWSAAGAALITMNGELVGITTTAATIAGHEQAAGYAIPINSTIRRIIDTLKEGREVEYGMLGITFGMRSLTPATAPRERVFVGEVFPGTPAARAGLQAGDIVMRVAGQPVNNIDAMQLVVSTLPPATSTTIEYERAGRAATAQVTLAKLAVAGSKIVTVRPDSWRGIRVDYATALEAAELTQAIASGAYDPAGCVLVSDVEPESRAWQAGVRPGMFISHVGERRVSTPKEFRAAVRDVGNEFDIRLTQPVENPSPAGDPKGRDSNSAEGER